MLPIVTVASLYAVALAEGVPICRKFVQPVPVQRSTRKPVSAAEVSAHASVMSVAEAVVAVTEAGAPGVRVFALDEFE